VSWQFHARTIRESHSVEQALNDLSHRFLTFEDAYDAFKWLLARSCHKLPKQVRKVGGVEYYLYVQARNPLAHTPRIRVLFTYSDDFLDILAVDVG
jgi:hypothetical protein